MVLCEWYSENSIVYAFLMALQVALTGPGDQGTWWSGSCMFLTATQYIIRVWIGWLGGCLLVLVRVEVVYCVRLTPFHMFYGGIVFVCLPAALATFLKQDVQNWSLFLCVKSEILNGKGLVVSLAGRLPLLSYQEVCTDSWSPEVILLMIFRWYLVDLWCVDISV